VYDEKIERMRHRRKGDEREQEIETETPTNRFATHTCLFIPEHLK
jgi:hypothetical protein